MVAICICIFQFFVSAKGSNLYFHFQNRNPLMLEICIWNFQNRNLLMVAICIWIFQNRNLLMAAICICWNVAKCVHEMGWNQKIKSPHFRFKWCFLCSGGLNMMIQDQIIQKKNNNNKNNQNNQKPTHLVFDFLWTGQKIF